MPAVTCPANCGQCMDDGNGGSTCTQCFAGYTLNAGACGERRRLVPPPVETLCRAPAAPHLSPLSASPGNRPAADTDTDTVTVTDTFCGKQQDARQPLAVTHTRTDTRFTRARTRSGPPATLPPFRPSQNSGHVPRQLRPVLERRHVHPVQRALHPQRRPVRPHMPRQLRPVLGPKHVHPVRHRLLSAGRRVRRHVPQRLPAVHQLHHVHPVQDWLDPQRRHVLPYLPALLRRVHRPRGVHKVQAQLLCTEWLLRCVPQPRSARGRRPPCKPCRCVLSSVHLFSCRPLCSLRRA